MSLSRSLVWSHTCWSLTLHHAHVDHWLSTLLSPYVSYVQPGILHAIILKSLCRGRVFSRFFPPFHFTELSEWEAQQHSNTTKSFMIGWKEMLCECVTDWYVDGYFMKGCEARASFANSTLGLRGCCYFTAQAAVCWACLHEQYPNLPLRNDMTSLTLWHHSVYKDLPGALMLL